MLRLVTWNVNARVGRLREQAAVIGAERPDVVALQEVTARTAPMWRAALAEAGLVHATTSFELAPDPALLVGPRRYGEVIASRWTLTATRPIAGGAWSERLVSAVVDAPWGATEVHTTHVPPGSSNGWVKIEMLEGIFALLARPAGRHRLLCGDLNTPRVERVDGAVLTWAQNEPSGTVIRSRGQRWDAGERNVLTGLAPHGLSDAFRALHGYGVAAESWAALNRGRRFPRRFDHVLSSMTPVAARYRNDWQHAGLSDHAALQVELSPGRAG